MKSRLAVGIVYISLIVFALMFVAFNIIPNYNEEKEVSMGPDIGKGFSIYYQSSFKQPAPYSLESNFDISLVDKWSFNMGVYNGEGGISYTPVIANVNGGVDNEIAVQGTHHVFVFKNNGNLLEGWPKKIGCYSGGGGPRPAPSIGDIDGDGENEILVTHFGWWGVYDDEGISCEPCAYAWNLDGTPVNGWPIICREYPERNVMLQEGSFVLSDLDLEPGLEAIANYNPQNGGGIYNPATLVFNGDGSMLIGWPFTYEPIDYLGHLFEPVAVRGSSAVGDVDCDGQQEIVTLVEGDLYNQRYFFIYILSSGGELEQLIQTISPTSSMHGSPTLIDLDNDCDLEIAMETAYYIQVFHHTGGLYDGWPREIYPIQLGTQLSVGQIGNNSVVAFGDVQGFYAGNLTLLKENGDLLWTKSVDGSVWVEPSLVDINNDSLFEIFTTANNGEVYGFDFEGNLLEGFPRQLSSETQSGTAIGDLDNDGQVELVSSDYSATLYVWNLESENISSETGWPQFQHDAQHTGNYNLGENNFDSCFDVPDRSTCELMGRNGQDCVWYPACLNSSYYSELGVDHCARNGTVDYIACPPNSNCVNGRCLSKLKPANTSPVMK